ncbi:ABC transporter ATP-binding protein [Candidatus Uhrbacteria bacterium]|nr:ABC transporter ATP-binding protein [Candidatus Uhrbacteria bacterium]
MNGSTLQLEKISVYYGGVRALHDVSLKVDEGETVALLGPNGAGKSTVLKAMFGLVQMSSGRMLWQGSTLRPIPHEVVHKGIAFVPQGRRVFAHLSVEENLDIGAWIVTDKTERERRSEEVMQTFPALRAKRRAVAGTLSGGQQQMLAIARGLMTDPKILLLDEPSLGLAPKIVREVFAAIGSIHERHKTAVVIVEHNIPSLLPIVDRAYVLDRGEVVAQGSGKEILEGDTLTRVLLGEPVHV